MYPQSNRAIDVLDTLLHVIAKSGHEIRLNASVRSVDKTLDPDARWQLITEDDHQFRAHSILIATGGASYPGTGSDAKLWPMYKRLGLEINEATAALVELLWVDEEAREAYKTFSGLSLNDVALTVDQVTVRADLLFTHKGISGPCALNLSGYFFGQEKDLTLNFYPGLSKQVLLEKMLDFLKMRPNAMFSSLLAHLLPKALASFIGDTFYFEVLDKHLSQVGHGELERLALQLQNFPLPRLKPGRLISGMVTRGGVKTWQLSPRSMEAKQLGGLYLAGEVLDIDGQTGGYNLQAAFSTAYIAVEALRGW